MDEVPTFVFLEGHDWRCGLKGRVDRQVPNTAASATERLRLRYYVLDERTPLLKTSPLILFISYHLFSMQAMQVCIGIMLMYVMGLRRC